MVELLQRDVLVWALTRGSLTSGQFHSASWKPLVGIVAITCHTQAFDLWNTWALREPLVGNRDETSTLKAFQNSRRKIHVWSTQRSIRRGRGNSEWQRRSLRIEGMGNTYNNGFITLKGL